MIFTPLYIYFENEKVNTFKVDFGAWDVPSGEYALVESYCADKKCDCRKAMIIIVNRNKPDKVLATIGYGWESMDFYSKWLSGKKEIAQKIKGVYLEPFGKQSDYAGEFLKIFKDIIENEPELVEDIKRHYKMFKNKIKSENDYFEDDNRDNYGNSIIKSADEAFFIIDNYSEEIPFEAIEYLHNCPDSKKITNKIIFALEHAYNGKFYDFEEDVYYESPLWHAIVAEKHLSKDLIDPIINLFITTEDDDDFLNEQGMYVLGKLAEKYPNLVLKKVMEVIDKMIKDRSHFPYLFLFDALYYADARRYKNWFLETLKKDNFYWKDSFVNYVADLKIKEAIPIIKDIISEEPDKWSIAEYKESLKQLETGIVEYPKFSKPYFQTRGNWKEHYSDLEDMFYEDECDCEDEYCDCDSCSQMPEIIEKIGRNEKCPCGSGKKYKKCCMDKDN